MQIIAKYPGRKISNAFPFKYVDSLAIISSKWKKVTEKINIKKQLHPFICQSPCDMCEGSVLVLNYSMALALPIYLLLNPAHTVRLRVKNSEIKNKLISSGYAISSCQEFCTENCWKL